MDALNAQQLHGFSPALDLTAIVETSLEEQGAVDTNGDAPLCLLQLAPYDPRHTVYTLSRCQRHSRGHPGPVHLYVYEEEPENLARHILLLSVLLDGSLLPKERMEIFLELHSNAMLRERTATYLESRGRELEAFIVSLSSKGELPTANASKVDSTAPTSSSSLAVLASILDISMLKFQDRDKLVDVFKAYRRSFPFDMVKAWDIRSRKWYGDRFDFRRNMIDWDYHMPLLQAGTPGLDPSAGSIIHFHHFRFWRMTGIAFELRDSQYNEPNRSLISNAVGRTKDFKDRNGQDVGRSVSAWGYWGDILNSPFHCFGTVSEDPSFFKLTNKQFGRTAVDVAEHNVLSLLHELRTGEPWRPHISGGEAHRARVARGPTSVTDLEEESNKQQKAEAACKEQEQQQQQQQLKSGAGSVHQGLEEDLRKKLQVDSSPAGQEQQQQQQQQQQRLQQQQALEPLQGNDTCSAPGSSFLPCAAFQGPKAGYAFKRGDQGLGYYADQGQQGAGQATRCGDAVAAGGAGTRHHPAGPVQGKEDGQQGEIQSPQGAEQQATQQPQGEGQASKAQEQQATQQPQGDGQEPQAQEQQATQQLQGRVTGTQADELHNGMAKEEQAIRQAEARLDAAAAQRLGGGRVRLVLLLGTPSGVGGGPQEFGKLLSGKAKFAGKFKLVTVGQRHVHMLGRDYGIDKVLAPGGLAVAESGKYMLQLNKEQAKAFAGKIDELAATSGLCRAKELERQLQQPPDGSCSDMILPDAHLLYRKPTS